MDDQNACQIWLEKINKIISCYARGNKDLLVSFRKIPPLCMTLHEHFALSGSTTNICTCLTGNWLFVELLKFMKVIDPTWAPCLHSKRLNADVCIGSCTMQKCAAPNPLPVGQYQFNISKNISEVSWLPHRQSGPLVGEVRPSSGGCRQDGWIRARATALERRSRYQKNVWHLGLLTDSQVVVFMAVNETSLHAGLEKKKWGHLWSFQRLRSKTR